MKIIQAYKVTLREVCQDDLEMLRNWRNMPEIRFNMINQEVISSEQQQNWFSDLHETNQQHFVVEYKGQAIGYANFKPDEKGNGGQTGLYIGNKKYKGTILAFCLALALLDYVFMELKVNHLEADVFSHNKAALRFNEQLGYSREQERDGLITMKLTIDDYLNAKSALTKLIRVKNE